MKSMMFGQVVAWLLVLANTNIASAEMFPQFATIEDIPNDYYFQNKVIYGKVERVVDGDTIRVRHCPTRFRCPKTDVNERGIFESTLCIRLYGVDCPDVQKKKSDSTSQPFAEEAKTFISNMVSNKKVRIKLLGKDQHGRAVGKVQTSLKVFPPFVRKDLSMELLSQGLATLSPSHGVQSDENRVKLEEKQVQAKKKRRGIWSLGVDMTSPGELKRQQKQVQEQSPYGITK
jgi:micrococcal nuclease